MKFSWGLIFSLALHMTMFAFGLILSSAGIQGVVLRDYKMVLLVSERDEKKAPEAGKNRGDGHNRSGNAIKKHLVEPEEKPDSYDKTSPTLPLSGLKAGGEMQISEAKASPQLIPESEGFSVVSVAGDQERVTPVRSSLSSSTGEVRGYKINPDRNGKAESGGNSRGDAIGKIRAAIEKSLIYPALAKRRGLEGTVTVQFTVDKGGNPVDIHIIRNSGFGILDSAAEKSIMNAAPLPFVRGEIEIPITFKLKKGQ